VPRGPEPQGWAPTFACTAHQVAGPRRRGCWIEGVGFSCGGRGNPGGTLKNRSRSDSATVSVVRQSPPPRTRRGGTESARCPPRPSGQSYFAVVGDIGVDRGCEGGDCLAPPNGDTSTRCCAGLDPAGSAGLVVDRSRSTRHGDPLLEGTEISRDHADRQSSQRATVVTPTIQRGGRGHEGLTEYAELDGMRDGAARMLEFGPGAWVLVKGGPWSAQGDDRSDANGRTRSPSRRSQRQRHTQGTGLHRRAPSPVQDARPPVPEARARRRNSLAPVPIDGRVPDRRTAEAPVRPGWKAASAVDDARRRRDTGSRLTSTADDDDRPRVTRRGASQWFGTARPSMPRCEVCER